MKSRLPPDPPVAIKRGLSVGGGMEEKVIDGLVVGLDSLGKDCICDVVGEPNLEMEVGAREDPIDNP